MRIRKFTAALLALVLVFTTAFVPVSAKAKPALNKTSITLKEGQKYQLKLKNASKNVTWISSNKTVATVTNYGNVSAKKGGSAVIQAKCAGITYKCRVTVKKTKLSCTSLTLNYGTEKTIKLNNAAFKVAWFSSNQKIAFCKNGTIEAKSVGTAVITAKCGGKSYSCTVTVVSGEDSSLSENGIYTSKEMVAEYLHVYGKLPVNFITKKEAEALGWPGGSLLGYAKYKCIGGDVYTDYKKELEHHNGCVYHECDINTLGALQRGTERIVYCDDGMIYYTGDHYQTFTAIYSADIYSSLQIIPLGTRQQIVQTVFQFELDASA